MSRSTPDAPRGRLIVIDLARSLALLGMVVFHFTYDLVMFGWLEPRVIFEGWFWYHARIVAGSFIFLAGVSLWLAHGEAPRWGAFGRRLLRIVAAAALVTLVSYLMPPGRVISYGILHSIAVSSVLGMLLIGAPASLLLALAAVVFALPQIYSSPVFDGWLVWTGLAVAPSSSPDFEPLFPWFAPFLAGMALGRIFSAGGIWERLRLSPTPFLRRLAWPGQHSLAIYLIHQPVLIGLVAGASWLLRG